MRSHIASLATAYSFLFVPGDRPDRFEKALTRGAEEVIVDLEDGVSQEAKSTARDGLRRAAHSRAALLRINQIGTEHHRADLAAIDALPWVEGVILPKVEDADEVRQCCGALPPRVAVVALVETARGVENVGRIAQSGVVRIMFGSVDFLADIGAAPHRDALSYPRSRLVVASRSAGLPPPVDGPCLATHDAGAVEEEARDARRLGMGGKLCIHPAQVGQVHTGFSPSVDELTWARRVLEAAASAHGGAFSFDGRMVDEPVLASAQQVLDQALRTSRRTERSDERSLGARGRRGDRHRVIHSCRGAERST
jgi:citrate lyase subunit beta / citryl-CoA lyase